VADLDDLNRLVTAKTRLILICAPNNPTGARFDEAVLEGVAAAADRVGAWVLSDEIYRGAERDGRESPSIWGMSDRVIVTSGLSKAYGLPGLRIGWIVSSPEFVASTWTRHDYTTIAPGAASDLLARMALEPERRAALIARTRRILQERVTVLGDWLAEEGCVEWAPPDAGAICYAKYDLPIDSLPLVERLRDEESVLIVPGAHFGMEKYVRIGFGEDRQKLDDGLARISRFIARIARGAERGEGGPASDRAGRGAGVPAAGMTLNLALAGFGNVARRFVRLLAERERELATLGLEPRIVGISTGRHGAVFSASGIDAIAQAARVERGERLDMAEDAGIDRTLALIARASTLDGPTALVETTPLNIAAGQPAIDHVRAAVSAGLHVVTANKGPAAFAARALSAEAAKRGVSFLFEGAVMDGIPI